MLYRIFYPPEYYDLSVKRKYEMTYKNKYHIHENLNKFTNVISKIINAASIIIFYIAFLCLFHITRYVQNKNERRYYDPPYRIM